MVSVLQCYGVLQCVAVYCSVMQCVEVWMSIGLMSSIRDGKYVRRKCVLQCYDVSQCVAVCSSV